MSKLTCIKTTSTETNIAKELKTYLELKLKKDIIKLAETEKATTEGLDALPELADSKDIKGFVKNSKIKPKMDLLRNTLSVSKNIVDIDKLKIKSCELTLALMETTNQFKVLSVISQNFQLLEEDINTLEVSPTILINEPKVALVFKDIFSRQGLRVDTCLDYDFLINQPEEDILLVETIPTHRDFSERKEQSIQAKKAAYNPLSNNDFSKEEFFKRADRELEELKKLSVQDYHEITTALYWDFDKVATIKKTILNKD